MIFINLEKDMKHTLKNQSKRAGIVLTAAVAFAIFGTGTAQAQTFTSVDFSIEKRTSEAKEVAAGDLNCSFRESDLGPYALVSYNCHADAVAFVEGCVYKNRLISDTELTTATDVSNVEDNHEAELYIAKANGSINVTVITTIPHAAHGGGGETELCPHIEVNGPEPEQEVIAIRWCNVSLTDTTNDLVGGTATELFEEFNAGAGVVPSCEEILAAP